MDKKMRKSFSFLIKISISAGILFFLFKRVDIGKIIQIITSADKSILTLAFSLIILIYGIGFFRWRMLLVGLGINLPNSRIFKSFCIGFFFNLLFPSTVGGDVFRGIDLGIQTHKPKQAIASVILDRLSGYTALVIVALFSLSLGYKHIKEASVFLALGIIVLGLIAALAVLFNHFLCIKVRKFLNFFGRAGEVLGNLHFEIYNFRTQKNIILKNFLYSFIIQLIVPLTFYLICLSLGARINPIYFFILVPIIATISALPISIGGFGLREASSIYFFVKVGVSAEIALTVSLLSFFMIFLSGIVAGVIYVITFSTRRL
ncbi:MAG: flippase-like domain-containing protein [Candidatus Omnitrophica bacterium]|nr:flippase-like domain-containing protein [Candidatus Omnitrophota bacterium]